MAKPSQFSAGMVWYDISLLASPAPKLVFYKEQRIILDRNKDVEREVKCLRGSGQPLESVSRLIFVI